MEGTSDEKHSGKRAWVSVEAANKRLKTDANREVKDRTQCPYLSAILRHKLNFDNERKCSVTVQSQNVYMCLICGQFFHGRGHKTPANSHALQAEHFMFADCMTGQIWCLPDMYEVVDDALADIKHNLNPSYTEDEIESALTNSERMRQIGDQTKFFRVGYVGLNNVKNTQYINAILQALLHLPPLVRHYMKTFTYSQEIRRTPIRDAFGLIFKKVWNPMNVFGQVAPRCLVDLLQEESAGWRNAANVQDPQKFLHFLLRALHEAERKALGKKARKSGTTIIEDTFQGGMRVTKREYEANRDMTASSSSETPFFTLPLVLPDNPLSRKEEERNRVPVQHIYDLLKRYNATTERITAAEKGKSVGYTYQITKLPKYAKIYPPFFLSHFFTILKFLFYLKSFCRYVPTTQIPHSILRPLQRAQHSRY